VAALPFTYRAAVSPRPSRSELSGATRARREERNAHPRDRRRAHHRV
jgi:hypothetical protein